MKKILYIMLPLVLISIYCTGCVACTKDEALSESIYFTDVHSEHIELGSAQLLIPAYAEIYQTEFETVECYVADNYYIVDGPTMEGEILGFSNNGFGRLTYTDITPNRICLITTAMAVSVPAEDRPAIISTKIYKNGVADDASFIGEYISDEDPADALPIMCLMELLNPNDYIEIYIASNTDNTTVVVNTMTLVATTVD